MRCPGKERRLKENLVLHEWTKIREGDAPGFRLLEQYLKSALRNILAACRGSGETPKESTIRAECSRSQTQAKGLSMSACIRITFTGFLMTTVFESKELLKGRAEKKRTSCLHH